MLEILDRLVALQRTDLNLAHIALAGIPLGTRAVSIPRDRIREVTLSPLVASARSGTDIEPEYCDEEGRRLSLDSVIDSVVDKNGIVHFREKISFKIADGIVVGFALYSNHLRAFDHLSTYPAFCDAFGRPDRVVRNEAYGDLMGFHHYYYRCRKMVSWDAWSSRVSHLNIGSFPGNDPTPA